MQFLRYYQLHRPVDTAIHAKQPVVDGYYIFTRFIIGFYQQDILLPPLYHRRNIIGKSAVTAFVLTNQFIIDVQVGYGPYSFKAQEQAFVAPGGIGRKGFLYWATPW